METLTKIVRSLALKGEGPELEPSSGTYTLFQLWPVTLEQMAAGQQMTPWGPVRMLAAAYLPSPQRPWSPKADFASLYFYLCWETKSLTNPLSCCLTHHHCSVALKCLVSPRLSCSVRVYHGLSTVRVVALVLSGREKTLLQRIRSISRIYLGFCCIWCILGANLG